VDGVEVADVPGLEEIDVAVEQVLVFGEVLAGDNREAGAEAVCEGVEGRGAAAFFGARPGGAAGVALVGLDLVGCGHEKLL
jgi:hypothetical protein